MYRKICIEKLHRMHFMLSHLSNNISPIQNPGHLLMGKTPQDHSVLKIVNL